MKTASKSPAVLTFAVLAFLSTLLLSVNIGLIGFEFHPGELNYLRLNPPEFPPLYSALVAGLKTIAGADWFILRLPSAVLGGLTLTLTFAFGLVLFQSRRAAAMACLILLSSKLFFRAGRIIEPDMAAVFCTTGAFYFLYPIIQSGPTARNIRPFYLFLIIGFLAGGLKVVFPPMLSGLIALGVAREWKKIRNTVFTLDAAAFSALILLFLKDSQYREFLGEHGALNLKDDLHTPAGILLHNLGYSFQHFWSHLDPWIYIGLPALVLSVYKLIKQPRASQPSAFLLLWLGSTCLCFSVVMKLKYNYIILGIPAMALLLGEYFVRPLNRTSPAGQIDWLFKTVIPGTGIILGLLALSGITVLLAGANKLLLIVFLAVFIGSMMIVGKSSRPEAPSVLLAILIYLILIQTPLMQKAGLLAYSSIQSLLQQNTMPVDSDDLIVSGSHDLSRDTLQLFFEQQIVKAGESYDDGTVYWLNYYLAKTEPTYIFILEDDFVRFLKNIPEREYRIIGRERLIKKSLRLDYSFFTALLKLDIPAVQQYLLDNVLLVYQPAGVQSKITSTPIR